MLLSISSHPHPYIPHAGLRVEDPDEEMKKHLRFSVVPNTDDVDFKAFSITQYVKRRIEERKKEAEENDKQTEVWMEKFSALSDEDKEKYRTEGYVPGLEPKPAKVELFDGVLIGEDLPSYLVIFLSGHLWRENIRTYFNVFHEEMKVVGHKETSTPHVTEPIEEPSGARKHMIASIGYSNIR